MRVLAVDDDPSVLGALVALLEPDHDVVACPGGSEALAALCQHPFDLVLTDLRMPAPDGFEVLRAARMRSPAPAVVVVTAVDAARAAIDALRLGACDYLVKPVEPADLMAAVAAADRDSAPPEEERDFGIIGLSAAIQQVRRLVPLLARSGEGVLVQGETGVGKELVARAIHEHGPRSRGPFVAHNMAATPSELAESMFFGHARGAFSGATTDHAGLFEQADGGTLFLDEIDSFPLPLQPKLLRVLEGCSFRRLGSSTDRQTSARVIAASSVDLRDLTARGAFRADLCYRLCQLEVPLPPLRERPEDIPPLIRCFLNELAAETGRPMQMSTRAEEILTRWPWPGNCRELRHTVRFAALQAGADPILPEHLPRALLPGAGSIHPKQVSSSLREVEREHIRRILEQVRGNYSLAARLLGIDRGTLVRKLRDVGAKEKSS